MSDTPETDNQSFVAEHNEGKELCVEAWFCEKLERERDEFREKVLELTILLQEHAALYGFEILKAIKELK